MKYMKWEDSAVLQEFGRIMQERDGLKKIAQTADSLNPAQQAAWANIMAGHGPGTKAWKDAAELLRGNKTYVDLMTQALDVYNNKSGEDSMAWKKFLDGAQPNSAMAKQPAPSTPAAPPMAGEPGVPPRTGAVLSQREKVADQKAYDVTPKEDLVHEAHPHPVKVCGDELVENLNEQQDADKAVAQKSAQLKAVLTALYKLAKRLEAEKNEEAFALVKETFLDISKSLKK